jgi:tetratricopeptide (TPR) repeat protein
MLVVALLVLFTTVPARADEAPDKVQEARQHYERGMTHYQLGEFTAAVEEFKAAYALSQAPGLLFNLAQASRLAKQYERAVYFYRTFLRVQPDAPNRADVEQRIAELEPLAQAQEQRKLDEEKAKQQQASNPSASTTTTTVTTQPNPNRGRALKVTGLVVGAVGVAALAVGAGLGVAVLDVQSQLNSLRANMGMWSQAQSDTYDRGQREATAATAMYVAGGVAVGTGIILYVIGRRQQRARYAVAPTPGGALAVGSWNF